MSASREPRVREPTRTRRLVSASAGVGSTCRRWSLASHWPLSIALQLLRRAQGSRPWALENPRTRCALYHSYQLNIALQLLRGAQGLGPRRVPGRGACPITRIPNPKSIRVLKHQDMRTSLECDKPFFS